ncbi:MAG: RpiB/LacA/LacB family sugar-phosphate isomerase [Solirubrobacteraceae bacterium]|nr:RpiB/LacA/LacB family sugar-phosphate isomerase [Solirubrobacteraceae bacterium]
MKVAIGYDHAGAPLADTVRDTLASLGHEVVDTGQSNDYPNIALSVGTEVAEGDTARGILVCGSGAGVSVAACKLPGIRAACAHDHYTAAQCVTHDDVNVLCLGARVIGSAVATELVEAFISAEFSGEERHARRLGKVAQMEADGLAAHLDPAP